LTGYRGYAWGPEMTKNFSQATCFYTETVTIDIGIEPGSLEAFATYLHSLADAYSHRDCVAAADALGWGWMNHTLVFVEDAVWECNYTPVRVSNDDSHGREFGKAYPDDSQRTDEAIRAVYDELVARARDKQEGVYQPLSLDTRLKRKLHSITLDKALYNYVHKWNFDQPFERRKYADLLAEAILAQRIPIDR